MAAIKRFLVRFASDGYETFVCASSPNHARVIAEHDEMLRLKEARLPFDLLHERCRVASAKQVDPEFEPMTRECWAIKSKDADGNYVWREWYDGRCVVHKTMQGAERGLEMFADDPSAQIVWLSNSPEIAIVLD